MALNLSVLQVPITRDTVMGNRQAAMRRQEDSMN